MNGYDELVGRIEAITGLNRRACAVVATSLSAGANEIWDSEHEFSAAQIVREAERLGYEFDKPEGVADDRPDTPEPEMSMDPAQVLAEVYMTMPRVRCEHMPTIGKAPEELRNLAPELVEQLPEDVRAMLVKIDVLEGKATFWVYDEANQIDRPIGPIDVSRFETGHELQQAFEVLVRRLQKVLAADFN